MTTKKEGAKVPKTEKAVNNATPAALRKVEGKKEEPATKEEKPEAKKLVTRPSEQPQPPAAIAATRIEKLEKMNRLAQKHRHLKAKDRELDVFSSTNDGTAMSMHISNGESDFEVTNTQVITEALKLLRALLDKSLSDTEKELIEFEV